MGALLLAADAVWVLDLETRQFVAKLEIDLGSGQGWLSTSDNGKPGFWKGRYVGAG
jgi:hypothetical protein